MIDPFANPLADERPFLLRFFFSFTAHCQHFPLALPNGSVTMTSWKGQAAGILPERPVSPRCWSAGPKSPVPCLAQERKALCSTMIIYGTSPSSRTAYVTSARYESLTNSSWRRFFRIFHRCQAKDCSFYCPQFATHLSLTSTWIPSVIFEFAPGSPK